jgi:hypothetical protein
VKSIGRLNETDLHEQLKHHYAGASGTMETDIAGFVVDVVHDHELIEIQTRGLGKLRRKIETLTELRPLRVVFPVAAETRIIKLDSDGSVISSRRSPKRGRVESLFRELTSIASLLPHPEVTVEVVLLSAVERRVDDGKGSWRRHGVSIVSRALAEIRETVALCTRSDYLALLPPSLPEEFTNRELSEAASLPYSLCQPMTSSFRKMGLIEITDKRGRELVYRISE